MSCESSSYVKSSRRHESHKKCTEWNSQSATALTHFRTDLKAFQRLSRACNKKKRHETLLTRKTNEHSKPEGIKRLCLASFALFFTQTAFSFFIAAAYSRSTTRTQLCSFLITKIWIMNYDRWPVTLNLFLSRLAWAEQLEKGISVV